jgi:hypothetical protein
MIRFPKNALLSAMFGVAMLMTGTPANSAPQYGSWGFDLTAMDLSVKPGDDFNRYASGAWLDRTTIPADKSAFALRLMMNDTIDARLHDLLEAAAASGQSGTLEGKAGAFYKSFMDEKRVQDLGKTAPAGACRQPLRRIPSIPAGTGHCRSMSFLTIATTPSCAASTTVSSDWACEASIS